MWHLAEMVLVITYRSDARRGPQGKEGKIVEEFCHVENNDNVSLQLLIIQKQDE